MDIKNFTVGSLFPILVRGKVHSQDTLPDGEGYFYVGAKKRDNGVMSSCGYDENLISRGNCIIFICNGEGSVGYCLYMDRPFYASGDLVLGYNDYLNPYIGMYLVTLLDRERPKYSFGRKYGTHIRETEIPLPATADGTPDWVFIENTIKNNLVPSLPVISRSIWMNNFDYSPLQPDNCSLEVNTWKPFRISEIFERFEPTKGTTTDELIVGTDVPYIAAKHTNNGLDMMCSAEDNSEFISEGNCIVFIQIGAGSAGYALYQGKRFIGMQGKTICAYSIHLNKYNGLFLATILSKERPKYSFGRSWTGDRLLNTQVLLPAVEVSTDVFMPDWIFMERYMKSLPYSRNV